MKKVALIMDSWRRFFTYAWPAGILQRIKETDEEVNLYIFNSSGEWSLDEDYNVGEYNIYRLPNLKEFDGIILDLNNVHSRDVTDYVVEAARKSGKPTISIANEIDDFYYVGIDNYKAIQELIAHLHEEHDCKKFWFVMGPEDNYENRVRLHALWAYMDEHGIEYSDDEFYYDSYEYQCGYDGFQTLMGSHHQRLPDAVICANDNIAVGVCEAAAKLGLRVPEDFCVTGFDDFDKASYYSPQITTVGHVREEVGYQCIEILLKLWKGEDVPRFNYTKANAVFSESCGCPSREESDQREHSKEQIMYGIETTSFEDQVLLLEYELIRCRTVREMTDCIPKCIPSMKCDAMYVILDDHMNDFRRQDDYYDRNLVEDDEFCVYGYPRRMKVEFLYENGERQVLEDEYIEGLFPMFEHGQPGTDFLFMPIHFRSRTVGYFVIRNAMYLMEKQYLFKILNSLTTAMENLHKKEKLEYLNQLLSDLYSKDAMTGMYNRAGYQKLAVGLFDEKKARKENLTIIFLDMDRLKYINDNFGHEYGDFAIKIITKAILNHSPEHGIPVRIGGDEFLLIVEMTEEEELAALIQSIRDEIHEKSVSMKIPIQPTVSVGYVITDMNTRKTLDDYVREADEVMYQEKREKHAERLN